jgi:DNA-binding MarR family transcriptional regulator
MIHIMNDNRNDSRERHPGLTPAQRARFSRMLDRLYQCCSDRHAALSEAFAIPQAEMRCLMLFGQERYLTAKGIASGLGIAKSRVTRLVEGLAGKGLVARTPDPVDSRVTLLGLTPAGRKTRQAIAERMDSLRDQMLERIEPARRDQVLESLETLKAAMERVGQAMEHTGGEAACAGEVAPSPGGVTARTGAALGVPGDGVPGKTALRAGLGVEQ